MRHVNLSIACILLSAGTFPVDAQTAAFPSTITIYIAGGAGSGMDISSRILGRHFSRYLPGTPHVLVQVMPGAGGLIAVNYLAKIAPKDGSALLTLPAVTIIEPLVTTNSVSADLSQFQWIGSMYKDVIICLSTRASKFTTIEDARQREMLYGNWLGNNRIAECS
jgi:tripartite-type tricarboxylate transporter receptor subunit TctC